jgi:hypothetical protein
VAGLKYGITVTFKLYDVYLGERELSRDSHTGSIVHLFVATTSSAGRWIRI